MFDVVTDGECDWELLDDPYDVAILGENQAIEMLRGKENLKKSLLKHFPGEERALDAYFSLVKQVANNSTLFFGSKVSVKTHSTPGQRRASPCVARSFLLGFAVSWLPWSSNRFTSFRIVLRAVCSRI